MGRARMYMCVYGDYAGGICLGIAILLAILYASSYYFYRNRKKMYIMNLEELLIQQKRRIVDIHRVLTYFMVTQDSTLAQKYPEPRDRLRLSGDHTFDSRKMDIYWDLTKIHFEKDKEKKRPETCYFPDYAM